ncbi:alanine racemase [Granulicatella seriolae]|uniref:Alanine racemase n=1 Tax=Granulicatella seriolae TaxID=2967226 RepID=A0ABT1WNR6_9LACT|nr:alanine racemase [Granulicatella seriolae]
MVVAKHRNTYVTVDLQVIRDNIKHKIAQMNPDQELYAVVKANAYGHGMIPVAKAALEAGASGFCVAVLDEGLALRQAGFTQPILILGASRPEDAALLAQNTLSATVPHLKWLQEAVDHLTVEKVTEPLLIHIALDTGMGRIGLRSGDQVVEMEDYISRHQDILALEGVFTHFAKADSADQEHVKGQVETFKQLLTFFKQMPKQVHCSNSAWAIWHELGFSPIVRYGIGIYGINPSNGELALPESEHLKPALRWDTEMVQVKLLPKGATISYGATYTCPQDEWIATLPVGYADGWLRSYHKLSVLVEGILCPIVGRVCMDQCMIRLPKEFPVGTKVTLIGTNGDKEITAEDVSQSSESIGYEVLCLIGERVPRVYINES